MTATATPLSVRLCPGSPGATLARPPWLRWSWRIALAGLILVGAGEVLRVYVGTNIHTVVPYRVYRSAQLSPSHLAEFVRHKGIRTIINLRGCCSLMPWYLSQCSVAQERAICQEDVFLSSGRLPPAHEIRRLVELLDQTEYPILLHCQRGADRTGLAAAMVALLYTDLPYGEARQQLGPRYGHLPIMRTAYLDEFFQLYETWLKQNGLEHSPAVCRRWLTEEYQGGWCSARFEKIERIGGAGKVGEPLAYAVSIRNIGVGTWKFRPTTKAGVHLAYSLRDAYHRGHAMGRAGLMAAEVLPGQTIDLTLVIDPIKKAGRYFLFIDMLDEQHGYFHQAGSIPHEEELIIRE